MKNKVVMDTFNKVIDEKLIYYVVILHRDLSQIVISELGEVGNFDKEVLKFIKKHCDKLPSIADYEQFNLIRARNKK